MNVTDYYKNIGMYDISQKSHEDESGERQRIIEILLVWPG